MILANKLKKEQTCELHKLEKSYYCMNERCKLILCPECYIEGHIGHKRGRIEEAIEGSKLTVDASMKTIL